MKQFNEIRVAVVAAVLILGFVSCSKDNDNPNPNPMENKVLKSADQIFNVEVSDDWREIASIVVEVTTLDGETTSQSPFLYDKKFGDNKGWNKENAEPKEKFTIKIKPTLKDGFTPEPGRTYHLNIAVYMSLNFYNAKKEVLAAGEIKNPIAKYELDADADFKGLCEFISDWDLGFKILKGNDGTYNVQPMI